MFLLNYANGNSGTVLAYTSADVASLDGRRLAFFFAKLIIGIGMGMLMSACQTYVSEVAPPRLRGALLGFFAFVVVSVSIFSCWEPG